MANVPGVFEIDIDDDRNSGLGYNGSSCSQNGMHGSGPSGSVGQGGDIALDIEIQVS